MTMRSRGLLVAACALLATAPFASAQQPTQVPGKTPAAKAPEKQPAAPASKAVVTWRGQVMAHLSGHKRTFSAGADGTSTIAFTIDRAGKVLSARLITSSGNATLDQEAVALAQRASPVPIPPSDLTGTTLNLTVPIRFKR